MKKYSIYYSLIFGIIFLAIGIYAKQLPLILIFGVGPILIFLFLLWMEHKEKQMVVAVPMETTKLILDSPIKLMTSFLRHNNYDIQLCSDSMTVIKQNDEICSSNNVFVAKSDGVYSCVERESGRYQHEKIISCTNLMVASFMILAYFCTAEIRSNKTVDKHEKIIISEIKRCINYAIKNMYNYEKGNWFINEIFVNIEKTSNIITKLGEFYDGGNEEQYISLHYDEQGYYIYENSWNYNTNTEVFIRTKRLDKSIIKKPLKNFIDYVKREYPQYEVDRYMQNNKQLEGLFE